MKRREFVKKGSGLLGLALASPLDRFITGPKSDIANPNVSKVSRLEELGNIVRKGEPTEVFYDLGEGRERTELLVTYIDGDSRTTNRIVSSPQIRLYEDNGAVSMDIADSDRNADGYSYMRLRPLGAEFEIPSRPSNELGYELGDLTINLENGRQLGISQYVREEQSL